MDEAVTCAGELRKLSGAPAESAFDAALYLLNDLAYTIACVELNLRPRSDDDMDSTSLSENSARALAAIAQFAKLFLNQSYLKFSRDDLDRFKCGKC